MGIRKLLGAFLGSKEDFWNSKYPKATVVLPLSYMPNIGFINVDVRAFFVNPHSLNLPFPTHLCDDQNALEALLWVIDHIKYTSDKSLFDVPEFWMLPSQTLHMRKGDCDDGAILLANLMLAAGIPYWKIRLTAGMVPAGGHAYVTYFCEEKDYWVTLDWCYYPNRKPVIERPDYKESPIYREVWFSFNQRYAFMKGVKAHD